MRHFTLRKNRPSKVDFGVFYLAGVNGGDMDEELANALLNDMDFEKYGKVMCSKIEQMLPKLMKMMEEE